MADKTIAARACFVNVGFDPDEYPELLAEVTRVLNEQAEGERAAGRSEGGAALARKDAALAAADKTLKEGKAVAEIWIPYLGLQGRAISGLVGFVTDVDATRARIAAALKEEKV